MRLPAAVALAALSLCTEVLACGDCGCCRAEAYEQYDIAASSSSAGEVIISEIMFNPAGTDRQDGPSGFNKEWVELYNTGEAPVHLVGWAVGNSLTNQWASPFPWGTWLGPQQAVVVTGDAATFDTYWGSGINRVELSNFPVLPNSPSLTTGMVALRDPFAVVRDEVNYQQAAGWPRINGTQGASIFALPSGLSSTANDIGMNWAPSAWGGHGAVFRNVNGEINHASPGYVATGPQEPFTPSPDAVWSMVILPDTQNYVKWSSEQHVFTRMTEWIRDNKDDFNIQVVLHEGDIVNNNNTNNPSSGNQTSSQQWQNAQASMHVLNGHVPYILAAGNHDYGTTNAQNRQTFLNDYFKASDNPLVDPAQGGILKGTMVEGQLQNAYYEFTAPDGRDMLIISLEWEPRPDTVAWANDVVTRAEFANHAAVILTHAYLNGNNVRYANSRVPEDASGQELWTNLIRGKQNIEIVFNGHFGGDGAGFLTSATAGATVQQMFFNTQFETQGGNGWLRLVEFLEDGTTVRVRTYSPYLDQSRTHSDFLFEFQISQLTPAVSALAGDYNGNGVIDAADYSVWRDSFGLTGQLAADGNGDGVVDHGDYEIWKVNFGAALAAGNQTPSTLPVPEPSGFAIVLVVVGLWAAARRRYLLLARIDGM